VKSRCVSSDKPQTGPSFASVELISAGMTYLSHTGSVLEFCAKHRETIEESNSMMLVENNITDYFERAEYDVIQWCADKHYIEMLRRMLPR
jgi:hypothetical protein